MPETGCCNECDEFVEFGVWSFVVWSFVVSKSCEDGVAEFWSVSESCFNFPFDWSEFLDAWIELHDIFDIEVCFWRLRAVIS